MNKNNQDFDLTDYLTEGVNRIVKDAIKSAFSNTKEIAFLVKYFRNSQWAAKQRKNAEKKGEHIPPFLIASITSKCNLHCAGCYAKANDTCQGREQIGQLSKEEWFRIFEEASQIGISFILLAGGEPLIREDVITAAAEFPSVLFPVFTNGTLLKEKYLELFDEKRNLIPIVSLEGEEELTDARRGKGIYNSVMNTMADLHDRSILFGTSVTVTSENLEKITSDSFIGELHKKGCKVVILVEYVPVDKETRHLSISQEERHYLERRIAQLRATEEGMVFISFPGDEKASGGCLAAGRGFFHINAAGGAEPCPFSPYSDTNLKEVTLREALHSPLFQKLGADGILQQEHIGGCVLFEQEELVKNHVVFNQ